MNILFLMVRKSVVLILIFICTFTALYVPQPWSNDTRVEAGNFAREITQQLNSRLLTSTAANTFQSAASEALLVVKEFELDGLAWILGKRLVSLLLADLTDWINSGFQGSPTFVRDLPRYLQEAADQTFGEYIENLDTLSFLCSPFELDINIALNVGYMRSRTERAPACTLTDISDNIDGFLSGNFGGDSGFGWQEWFQITAQPETYTPYGSFLTAQTGLDIAISSRERDRLTLLDFGNGFMSSEVCRTETGPSGTREICEVSTPGKIVQEALSFNLDTGRESLVAADEVDEVIGALIDQLTQMALGGMQSIFGLSEGDGPGTTRGLRGEVGAGTLVSMTEALQVAREYLQTANQIEPCVAQSLTSSQQVTVLNARRILAEIDDIQADAPVLITQLETLISRYNNSASLPANEREAERRRILSDFYRLRPYSDVEASSAERRWGESTNCSRTGPTIIDDGGGGGTGSGSEPIFPNSPNPPILEPVATST